MNPAEQIQPFQEGKSDKTDEVIRKEEKKKPRRIIRRRRKQEEKPVIDPELLEKVVKESSLPKAYNFEILKSVERIHRLKAIHVALQMPEGLLMYATVLGDVLKRLVPFLEEVSILGDVTYGACCVDDLGSRALGAQLLIHYGHSCLVPIQQTVVPCLYVFVEITIDVPHLVECVKASVPTSKKLAVLGTIQFRQGVATGVDLLREAGYDCVIPQAKPLSPGEVLGCTSPSISQDVSTVIFLADGRFHLESCMIANPHVKLFLRYDPYGRSLTTEAYGHEEMKDIRQSAIQKARQGECFGLILGTLGRQGNPAILRRLMNLLRKHSKRSFIILLSEISPAKLAMMPQADVWVQVACPRLSVDWGHCFGNNNRPVLSPYELHVALEEVDFQSTYPMDFYSQSGGPWSNYHPLNKERKCDCVGGNGCE